MENTEELKQIKEEIEVKSFIENLPVKTEQNTSYMIYETIRQNSFEFGKAGNRFKLYFQDAKDLKKQQDELRELGLFADEVYAE